MITENYGAMNRESKFANRSAEIDEFLSFAHDGRLPQGLTTRIPKRVLLFRTSKATGSSSFLKHLMGLLSPHEIAVYSDLWSEEVSQFFATYKDQRNRRFLCRVGTLFDTGFFATLLSKVALGSTILLPVPARVGATALVGLGEGIVLGQYPSSELEQICRSLQAWPRPPAVFFLDNAQQKPYELLNFLKACSSDEHYGHVRFVIAYSDTEEKLSFDEFRKRIPFPPRSISDGRFRPLGPEFVAAIATAHGLDLDRSACEAIARRAKNDVWDLLRLLHESDSQATPKLEVLGRMAMFVLRLLVVAEQSLRVSDIRLLGLRSQLVFDDELGGLETDLDVLSNRRLIERTPLEGSDALVGLATQSAPIVRGVAQEIADNLVVMRDLYDYFYAIDASNSTRHAASSSAGLLYRLARVLDPAAVPELAQRLVQVAMGQGSLEDARRYIDAARPREGALTLHDQFVQIAFFVSVQEYERAGEVLNAVPRTDFGRYRVLRILDAVTLNRMRDHENSDSRIDVLLSEESPAEEKCLLVSYKIGGLLHEGRYEAALDVFQEWEPLLRSAQNHPYLLRNSGAVYMWGERRSLAKAEAVLESAITAFTRSNDYFGLATTKCNLGVAKAYRGDLAEAEKLFRQSYDHLSVLGTQHIEESGTNLGTVLLLRGRDDEAHRHLTKLLSVIDMDFPRVIAECDMAILDAKLRRYRAARERMHNLVSIVDSVKLREASRLVRLTAALVEVAGEGGSFDMSEQYLADATRYSDELDDHARIRQALTSRSLVVDDLCMLYPHEFLQYWSQNPLKMLPAQALTQQTVLHHVT